MPYRTSLTLLQCFLELFGDSFAYKMTPYEYEYSLLPLDMILGSKSVRKRIESGVEIGDLEKEWQEDLQIFVHKRREYLLYR